MKTILETSETLPKNDLSFLWIELTNKCNLNCIHCYADSSPFNKLESIIDYKYWNQILKDAHSLNCKMVQFIGGEPTLYPHLNKLISDAKNIGYEFIEVYTNGTVISDEHIKTFIKNDVHIAFSIYSNESGTHEIITKGKGSFQKTIKNIKKVIDSGLNVRASIIEMKENKDSIEKTESFVKEVLGITNVGIDKSRGIGRSRKNITDEYAELCGACWKGRLAINSDGNVFPCVFSRFASIGNIKEGLANILNKNELSNFRAKVKNLENIQTKNNDPCRPIEECNPYCKPNCTPNCSPQDIICGPF